MVALAVLSLIPGTAEPGDSELVWIVATTPSAVQNAMHVVMYGLLTGLWIWTLDGHGWRGRIALTAAITLVLLFGTAMEVAQLVVPGRFASLNDLLLDGVGITLGASAARWLFGRAM